MMGGFSYTHDQLLVLRESPLVKKPDGLPSISQWMDVPAEQNNNQTNNNGTARRARGMRDGEASAPSDQRPLINPMGQFGRRQSMRKLSNHGMVAAINSLFIEPGEETVLGPPKLSFLSASRNAVKAPGDAKERTGIVSIDGDNLGDRFPRDKNERWTRDRDTDRNRDKGFTNGRRGGREEGEGWTNVKGRKSIGQEDFERFSGRNGDRNRDKQEGDPENDMAPRRGNRDRAEPRWGRRDETKEEGTKAGLQGGWRERDRDRERERDRDWTRGGNRAEEDPEWMDTKVEKKEFKPRTQEDFQRWKEQMRAKDTPAEEKEEHRAMSNDVPTATGATVPPMLTQAVHTPSGAEPTQGILFGNWGRDKAVDISPTETMSAKPKPDKKSRFMTMFAKPEESAPAPQSSMPAPAMPAPGMGASDDKEGFQRILQMLGQTNIGGAPLAQPSPPGPSNGMRHGGGVSLDYHQQTPPPEPQHNRPPRTLEQQNMLENILAQRPSAPESRSSQQARFASMSPDNAMQEQFRHPRVEGSMSEDHFHQQAPSRNANGPDANLAALLSGRAREESQRDQATKQRERDFLLTLMQQPSRNTPPQMNAPNLPRQNQDNHLPPFFDQGRQQIQGPSKGRPGPPPGFMEDSRMFNENVEMARRDAERREQEMRQQLSLQQQQQQEAMRAKNARMPMGFPGHDDAILAQRRNTAGDGRPMTNMGIPSQPVPDMAFMGGRGQPGMPPTPQERGNIAPPPGFGGGGPMRQPPGLNGPNPQQQMGLGGPNFSAGNTPLGHPPGFAPPGNMRGMGFPGGPGGNGMQGPPPPQGYFPPGYGPPQGMRGEDPRMMFEGHQPFGGPGPRQQQGRPGPPGMY
ncbi:hypothetical protein DE146DRAFT_100526 [Phaeosphaeria sp. MPI-PUGE-AT-0046c]|nr:hypothetical protein DE146DRAFT_100526 [Phaeosphaeria sp. MPI-PUGE-AT-0046c]